jgi:predicted membrane protein
VNLPIQAGYTRVEVESGAASVTLRVPEDVAARIKASGGLSEISVDQNRFPRTGNGYQSADYDTAANKVDILIETGVGSVKVK